MESLVGLSADEGAEQAPELIDPTNYATDKKVVARVLEEIVALIPSIRAERMTAQERWDRYWKVWLGIHHKKMYEGRADLYWRLGYKIAETFVSHIKTQAFPHIDSFQIEPSPFDPMSMVQAPIARQVIRHDIEQAKVERHMDPFLRSGLVTGCSIVKTVWKTIRTKNYKRVRVSLPTAPGLNGETLHGFTGDNGALLYEGPTFQPLNLLDWFIHPITSTDIEDARMVFEDVRVDKAHLRSMAKKGAYENVEALFEKEALPKGPSETAASKDDRNTRYGVTEAEVARKMPGSYVLQEIYAKFDLYGKGDVCECKIVVCDDVILEIKQNPYFFQSPPYLAWRCFDIPNFFYGAGVIEPIEHMNIAANAIGNQMLDAVAMQVNHILGVNVAMLGMDVSALRIAPRAIWPALGNPDEVFKEFRPADNTSTALAAMQVLSGAMQDIAGAPPILQGKIANKDTTATEISAVAAGATAALQGMVRNVESHVLSPMLQRWWVLEQQFRAVESAAKLGNRIKVEPTDLIGDYGFRWKVSTQVSAPVAAAQEAADAAMAQGGQLGMGTVPGGPAPMGAGMPAMGGQGMPPGGFPGMPPNQGMGTEAQFGL